MIHPDPNEAQFRQLLREPLTDDGYQDLIRLLDELGVTRAHQIVRNEAGRQRTGTLLPPSAYK